MKHLNSTKKVIMSSNLLPLSLYVHWPFCRAKCPYCDFNSHVRDDVDHGAWLEAFQKELHTLFALLGRKHQIKTIFFGGGTPSLMAPETVKGILETAKDLWAFDDEIEITLEANPTSTENDKLIAFKEAGINRVSIGIQALNDQDLKALGREHNASDARRAITLAQEHFKRFSFDLIYTREGQNRADWGEELKQALDLTHAGHLSLYQLTIEPGTQFQTLFDSGRLTLPDDDESSLFFEDTVKIMEQAGMPPYEVSNFARQGEESRHNLNYWHYGVYAGIGPGAHGRLDLPSAYVTRGQKADFDQQAAPLRTTRIATRAHKAPEEWLKRRLNNPKSMDEVSALCDEGAAQTLFDRCDILSQRDQLEEMMIMGLRLYKGVALDIVAHKTGLDPIHHFHKGQFNMMLEHGLILHEGHILKVNPKGMPVLNQIINALLVH
jgi:oxygen-independent coproporphyrinogen-3 oxidase